MPAGSTIANGDSSDASDLNTPLSDIETDANTARPIVAGGTGATSAADARNNLVIAFEFIESQDASSSATLDFDSFNASKYDAYMFVLANIVPATDGASLILRTSANGGSSYDASSSDYSYSAIVTVSAASTPTGGSQGSVPISGAVGSAANEDGVSGTVHLYCPHLSKRTRTTSMVSYQDTSANLALGQGAGQRNAAAAVDAVRFLFSSGNIESGTITMYGLRNSL